MLEAGCVIEDDACWVGYSHANPLSVGGQYLSLSCWARSLSPTGALSRASVRMYQVGGGLVHFNQTVSISSSCSVIGRFSLRMHLRVSIGTCNCTPRENHLSETGSNSQCRAFRSPWPTQYLEHNSIKIPIVSAKLITMHLTKCS